MTEAVKTLTLNDFGWTAKLLRSGDERIVKATLSNNINVILAALDRAAAAPDLLAALKHCVIERSEWLEEARAAVRRAEAAR